MNTKEIFNKMKEENKMQEELLKQKIIEGNDALKKKLDKIKKDMEKISIYSHVNYETIKTPPLIEPPDINDKPLYQKNNNSHLLKAVQGEDECKENIDEEGIKTAKNEFTLNNQKTIEDNLNDDLYLEEKVKETNNQPKLFPHKSSEAQIKYNQMSKDNKLLNDTNKTLKCNEIDSINEKPSSNNHSNTIKQNQITLNTKSNNLEECQQKQYLNKDGIKSSSGKTKPKTKNEVSKSNKRHMSDQHEITYSLNNNIPNQIKSGQEAKHYAESYNNEQEQLRDHDSDKENPLIYEQPILKSKEKAKPKRKATTQNQSNTNIQLLEENTHNSNNNSNRNDNITKSSKSAIFQGQDHNYNQSNNNTGNDFYSNYDNNNLNNQTNSYLNNNNSQMHTGREYYQENNICKNEIDKNTKVLMNTNQVDDSQCESSNNTKNNFYNTNKSSKTGFNQNYNTNNNHYYNSNDYSNADSSLKEKGQKPNQNNINTGSPQIASKSFAQKYNNTPSIGFGRTNPNALSNSSYSDIQKQLKQE